MRVLPYLRDAAVFAPCYLALDWASYFDAVGPFNITPWNPQPALAVVWMMLGGFGHIPAVCATIALAEILVRHAPGGWAITAMIAATLTAGYAGVAWALKALMGDTGLRTTRQLTVFIAVTVFGAGLLGAVFVGLLEATGMLHDVAFTPAWIRFWIGDAVGILVTAPLLFAAVDPERRAGFAAIARRPEAMLQMLVLAVTLFFVFGVPGADAWRQFYLLFLPLIWIGVRLGLNGAIVAIGIVQIGVVLGVQIEGKTVLPLLDFQARLVAFTLTGLFLGVVVDQRQRAEESLHQTLRLAAAGEMAGAIAHEVNQPLTAVTNYGRAAQMLLERGASGMAQVGDIVGKILAEAERAAEVVRRLRDFFRAGTTRLETIPVEELLATTRRVAERAIGDSGIALEIDGQAAAAPLFVDRLQVEVILRNLIDNAVESLAAAHRGGGRIRVGFRREDDRRVRIVVEDNGPGVAETVRKGLFEPFVSGKSTGMGLGLAVSRAIAEAHGGSLEAVPAGHGEFHLVLPCVRSA